MKDSSELDDLDWRILAFLQDNNSLRQQDLAEAVNSSAPTVLRRVQRLKKAGWIEREIAILNADKIAAATGHGLHAIIEVTLEQQSAQLLDEFERAACARREVQQCYRTSAGQDFVLIVQVADMPAYQAFASSLLAQDRRVRNVKTYFASKRAKFSTVLDLGIKLSDQAVKPA